MLFKYSVMGKDDGEKGAITYKLNLHMSIFIIFILLSVFIIKLNKASGLTCFSND